MLQAQESAGSKPGSISDKSTTIGLEKTPSYFAFLSLPRELRDHIYGYALQGTPYDGEEFHPQILLPDSEQYFFASLSCKTKVNLSLLCCSKQIYEEAIEFAYNLNTFQLEIKNFVLPDQIENWPFWGRVKHLDVHALTQDPGSLSTMAQLLLKRGVDLKIHILNLVSSMKGGILNELQELSELKVHDQVTIYLDTTTTEHVAVRDNLGLIMTKMIGKYR